MPRRAGNTSTAAEFRHGEFSVALHSTAAVSYLKAIKMRIARSHLFLDVHLQEVQEGF